jgi:2-polyprenyl-3-methyl-5-hydroxy-6-metoxy-1,4-benzoquinol methylase
MSMFNKFCEYKKLYQNLILPDYETEQVLMLIQQNLKKNDFILDVGCGNARYLSLLKQKAYTVEGVEKNIDIVNQNKKNGFTCYTPEEFELSNKKYKLIILSHIIEHFSPDDLLKFLNYYLTRLETNGYIIIATPLHSPYFYDDFDHVKPYHPLGIEMVFGKNRAQVQYQSDHKLELKDIWYRKSPFLSTHQKSKYIKSFFSTRFYQLYDFISAMIYHLSFGVVGRKDGWVGLYVKVS